MKVLLCFHSMVTRSNHRLAEELSRAGEIELHVLTPEWWPEEARHVRLEKTWDANYTIQAAPIFYWKRPMPNLFMYRNGLAQVLRRVQPDILDFYAEPFSLAMGQALALKRLYARDARLLFYSAQNIYKNYPPPFRWFEQWAFRSAAAAYVCNTEAGEVLRQKGYKGTLRYIPLGVDPEVFKPLPAAERKAALLELGLTATRPVIGYLGRLHWEKGLSVLLEAMVNVPEAQLLLIGDGPHRAEMAEKAAKLGLSARTCFTGAINRLAVPEYLNCLDALVVPSLTTSSWKEQFGRIIVEAFLCGIPVIGSSCGSIPELIGNTGVVVPEGAAEPLARAISQLLGQPQARQELAKAARQRALNEFTWSQVAQQRLQLYREALSLPETDFQPAAINR